MIIEVITGIICTIIAALPFYKLYELNNNIKKCWSKIRCTAVGQLLHPFFGPKNISMNQNSMNCDNSKFSVMFNSKISNVNKNIDKLNKYTNNSIDFGNGISDIINNIKQIIINEIRNVGKAISDIIKKIGKLGENILEIVKKLVEILGNIMKIGVNIFYTISSLWNGPVGRSMQFFGGGTNNVENDRNQSYRETFYRMFDNI